MNIYFGKWNIDIYAISEYSSFDVFVSLDGYLANNVLDLTCTS